MVSAIKRALWPWLRYASIAYYRWARRDLQRKDPHHKDLAVILRRLNELERNEGAPA